jgi:hypothetical protein
MSEAAWIAVGVPGAHNEPRIGALYHVRRVGEEFVGECVQLTPYQVALRIEDEDQPRWVSRAEIVEVRRAEAEADEVPSLAECRDMLAIVMAALEHYEREEPSDGA